MKRMSKTIHGGEQKVLCSLLVELRTTAQLRQEDIAEKLGKPQSFVSKYESGERRLDVLELRAVCWALGTTLSNFVVEFERKLKR